MSNTTNPQADHNLKHQVARCKKAHQQVDPQCPVRGIMDKVGSKWSVLIIMVLSERSHRFGELKREVPDISQRMLTQTLRELQRDGLINRTVHATTPPTVEYSLTDLGKTLLGPLTGLLSWAEKNSDDIRAAREAFDQLENPETAKVVGRGF